MANIVGCIYTRTQVSARGQFRGMTGKGTKQRLLRVDPERREALGAAAARRDTNRSDLLRLALDAILEADSEGRDWVVFGLPATIVEGD